jgi:hypothetical protein
VELEGKTYAFLVGSDVTRGGMYVEVTETTGGVIDQVAELFCPFGRQAMLLTLWRQYVPTEVVDAAVRTVREQELAGR